MEKKNWKPATLCVQAGWEPKNGESRVLPIYQSTTFKYDNTEEMADLFDLKKEGYFYTRLANPTNDAVARKIAALEGGVGAMLTSSGQAANFYALFNICEAGDHFVTSNEIYGGTYNLIVHTLATVPACFGIHPTRDAAIKYIAFLNVTVNNILLFTVIQRITDIDSNFKYIIHGDLSGHYILAQISQEFHSYKNRIGVTVSDHCIIIDNNDIGSPF